MVVAAWKPWKGIEAEGPDTQNVGQGWLIGVGTFLQFFASYMSPPSKEEGSKTHQSQNSTDNATNNWANWSGF